MAKNRKSFTTIRPDWNFINKRFKNFGNIIYTPLRACSWGSEFILHTDIPVKMGKINAFDREFSPLAPSVRALELNSVFISNGCLALHDKLTVSRFLLFWLKFKSLQKLLVGIWNIDFLCDQLVKVDFELPNDV